MLWTPNDQIACVKAVFRQLFTSVRLGRTDVRGRREPAAGLVRAFRAFPAPWQLGSGRLPGQAWGRLSEPVALGCRGPGRLGAAGPRSRDLGSVGCSAGLGCA